MATYLVEASCGCVRGVLIGEHLVGLILNHTERGEAVIRLEPGTVKERVLSSTLISECPHKNES
jgi:hypothetical protein